MGVRRPPFVDNDVRVLVLVHPQVQAFAALEAARGRQRLVQCGEHGVAAAIGRGGNVEGENRGDVRSSSDGTGAAGAAIGEATAVA